jgi:sulfide:quinone oxidoreductase
MNDSKTVVVLGGGVGGVVAAIALRKRLPSAHRVVVVDRSSSHLFSPSLLWLMTGSRSESKITRPMERLSRRGIEFIRDEIVEILPETRRVRLGEGQTLDADYLIISLGADLDLGAIPGLAKTGHCFYNLEGAESLRDALATFDGGRIVVLTAAPAYKCPAAPYEAAMLLKDFCKKRGIGGRTQVDLYAAEPGPMGVTGPEVSAAVRKMVEDSAIGYHPEHQISHVDAATRTIVFDNGTKVAFDLLAYVPPHRPPKVVSDTGLVDETGWVPVDRHTMETNHEGVYAVGDVTRIPLAVGKPLPMAGVFAERQATVVAENVATAITGEGSPATFNGHGECFIETGSGKAGFGRGNFYSEPSPQITLHQPSRRWHIGKVMFEKGWLRRF